ncbi:hypothetical protein AGOR_G00032240 [Albula goreensis]|uniref:Uncharacterized protein n=1 Tax=Albula goreensis TaxID=1534307 RepID=A0A8T3E2V7_9TELE|nr:hypothetical protein AGOR_G00032240 [Albula goreensis]
MSSCQWLAGVSGAQLAGGALRTHNSRERMTEAKYPPPPMEPGEAPSPGPPPLYCPPTDGCALDQPPPYMPPPYPPAPALYPPAGPPAPPGEADSYALGEPHPPLEIPGEGGLPQDSTNSLLVSSFEDKTIRRAFIRKVFSVVTLQLLVTFSVVCVFTFSGAVRDAVQGNIWVYISSYIIFIVVALCLNFSSTLSRKHPWNLVALAVVTLSLSYMVGTAASYHSTTAVVIAMGATMVISFIIIIFSAQTRVDFTVCNGILLVLSVDLLMFGLLCCFYYTNVLQVVYGCLGALLYSLFLAVDCQLVMGRQTYALSPEEYVFASLILYLDIITIFLYLLILLGGSSSN